MQNYNPTTYNFMIHAHKSSAVLVEYRARVLRAVFASQELTEQEVNNFIASLNAFSPCQVITTYLGGVIEKDGTNSSIPKDHVFACSDRTGNRYGPKKIENPIVLTKQMVNREITMYNATSPIRRLSLLITDPENMIFEIVSKLSYRGGSYIMESPPPRWCLRRVEPPKDPNVFNNESDVCNYCGIRSENPMGCERCAAVLNTRTSTVKKYIEPRIVHRSQENPFPFIGLYDYDITATYIKCTDCNCFRHPTIPQCPSYECIVKRTNIWNSYVADKTTCMYCNEDITSAWGCKECKSAVDYMKKGKLYSRKMCENSDRLYEVTHVNKLCNNACCMNAVCFAHRHPDNFTRNEREEGGLPYYTCNECKNCVVESTRGCVACFALLKDCTLDSFNPVIKNIDGCVTGTAVDSCGEVVLGVPV